MAAVLECTWRTRTASYRQGLSTDLHQRRFCFLPLTTAARPAGAIPGAGGRAAGPAAHPAVQGCFNTLQWIHQPQPRRAEAADGSALWPIRGLLQPQHR